MRYISFFLIAILITGCNSNDEDVKKLKLENQRLKNEIEYKERLKLEEEKQRLEQEVDQLRKEQQNKNSQVFDEGDNSLKTVKVTIIVDKLKNKYSKWDGLGGPDIAGYIKINNRELKIKGPEDQFEIQADMHDINLKTGDNISISLYDKDFSEHDLIMKKEISYDGKKNFSVKSNSAFIRFIVE